MKVDDKKYCITSIKKTIMRMRKLLFIFVAVLMVACTMSPEERAEELVTEYIKSGANDPSSVQDVEVSPLRIKLERDAHGNDFQFKYTTVRYRAKNAYGALARSDLIVVKFDYDVTEILCFDCLKDPYW